MLHEDINDQLDDFIGVKVTHALLIQALLYQVYVKHVVQRALQELRLVVDASDQPVAHLSIVARVDFTGEVECVLRHRSQRVPHLMHMQNAHFRY